MPLSQQLLALQQQQHQPNPLQQEQQPAQSWVQDLISSRTGTGTERQKRKPIGFEFKRDPFDPSSYYKQLGQYRDISTAATAVAQQEAANREEASRARDQAALQEALGSIGSPGAAVGNAIVNASKKYNLKGVSSTTSKAADYFGSKYGIRTVYGLGKGSVPGSDHPHGRAIDLMINNLKNGSNTGTAMANDIIAHYKDWNVKYVIWNRYIWHPGRGWTKYSGPSAHTDHVHVSFNK
jgi:hypothetical protein